MLCWFSCSLKLGLTSWEKVRCLFCLYILFHVYLYFNCLWKYLWMCKRHKNGYECAGYSLILFEGFSNSFIQTLFIHSTFFSCSYLKISFCRLLYMSLFWGTSTWDTSIIVLQMLGWFLEAKHMWVSAKLRRDRETLNCHLNKKYLHFQWMWEIKCSLEGCRQVSCTGDWSMSTSCLLD